MTLAMDRDAWYRASRRKLSSLMYATSESSGNITGVRAILSVSVPVCREALAAVSASEGVDCFSAYLMLVRVPPCLAASG